MKQEQTLNKTTKKNLKETWTDTLSDTQSRKDLQGLKYQHIANIMQIKGWVEVPNAKKKIHIKWKAHMAKRSKDHAKFRVSMPKCSKYHAEWQVLVPNGCKYKASSIRKKRQKESKTWGKKKQTVFYTCFLKWTANLIQELQYIYWTRLSDGLRVVGEWPI